MIATLQRGLQPGSFGVWPLPYQTWPPPEKADLPGASARVMICAFDHAIQLPGPPTCTAQAQVFIQIADGLKYIHSQDLGFVGTNGMMGS